MPMQRDEYYVFEYAIQSEREKERENRRRFFCHFIVHIGFHFKCRQKHAVPDAMMHHQIDNRVHSIATAPMAVVALMVQL